MHADEREISGLADAVDSLVKVVEILPDERLAGGDVFRQQILEARDHDGHEPGALLSLVYVPGDEVIVLVEHDGAAHLDNVLFEIHVRRGDRAKLGPTEGMQRQQSGQLVRVILYGVEEQLDLLRIQEGELGLWNLREVYVRHVDAVDSHYVREQAPGVLYGLGRYAFGLVVYDTLPAAGGAQAAVHDRLEAVALDGSVAADRCWGQLVAVLLNVPVNRLTEGDVIDVSDIEVSLLQSAGFGQSLGLRRLGDRHAAAAEAQLNKPGAGGELPRFRHGRLALGVADELRAAVHAEDAPVRYFVFTIFTVHMAQ